jgi:glycosyltransferase involved in cell wall biosynthesis
MSVKSGLISVIMPVYNGEAFVGQAIESVLCQPYRPLELIVVDDGSTDRTAALVQRFGDNLRYGYQANRGPAAARNHGLRLAAGEFVAFLDADDLWAADKLAVQLPQLMGAAVDIAVAQTQFICDDGDQLHLLGEPCPQLLLGAALFRRSVFEQVGIFDESLWYCDDWDWFMRARELNIALQTDPAVVLYYRRHQNNLTRSPQSKQELLKLLGKSLQRRRQQGAQARSLPAWFAFE